MRGTRDHNMGLTGGLVTNYTPESVATVALRQAVNVDGYNIFRGLGKIPGSSLVSPDLGGAVASLNHFEHVDLTGALRTSTFALANGTLRKFESTSSWPAIAVPTGVTLTDEPLSQAESLGRLFFGGPSQFGLITGGLKWDGDNITNWGVLAPGDSDTTFRKIDSAANWTAAGADTTLVTDTTVKRDATASIEVRKSGGTEFFAGLDDTFGAVDLSGFETMKFWVFIPAGGLLAKISTINATLSSAGGATDLNDYSFESGTLLPGWNELKLDLSNPSLTVGAPNLAAVNYAALSVSLDSASTDFTGIRFDQWRSQVSGKLTPSVGGANSGQTGTFRYRVTYLTESGVESNAGDISDSVTVTDQFVNLSNIPVSPDTQVIARRIYRDNAGDNVFRFVFQLNDNISTSSTDLALDADLGLTTPPIAGDDQIDHSPPPRVYDCVAFADRVWVVPADQPNVIWPSGPAAPEEFRIIDQIPVDQAIIAIKNHAAGLLLYGQDKMWLLTGDGVDFPFKLDTINEEMGANGRFTASNVEGLNFTVRESEVHLVANPNDAWMLNGPILNIFQGFSQAERQNMFVAHDRSRFRLVFFLKGQSTAYVYQYGTVGESAVTGDGAGVDPRDLRDGQWYQMAFPTPYQCQSARVVERDVDVPELWMGGNDGYVYYLQDPVRADWALGGLADTPVQATIGWHDVPLGYGLAGRGEARYGLFNFSADARSGVGVPDVDTDWTISGQYRSDADGDFLASVLKTFTAGPSDRSPIVSMPAGGRPSAWFRLTLTSQFALGGTGVLTRAQLFYQPRSGFQGERSG